MWNPIKISRPGTDRQGHTLPGPPQSHTPTLTQSPAGTPVTHSHPRPDPPPSETQQVRKGWPRTRPLSPPLARSRAIPASSTGRYRALPATHTHTNSPLGVLSAFPPSRMRVGGIQTWTKALREPPTELPVPEGTAPRHASRSVSAKELEPGWRSRTSGKCSPETEGGGPGTPEWRRWEQEVARLTTFTPALGSCRWREHGGEGAFTLCTSSPYQEAKY